MMQITKCLWRKLGGGRSVTSCYFLATSSFIDIQRLTMAPLTASSPCLFEVFAVEQNLGNYT